MKDNSERPVTKDELCIPMKFAESLLESTPSLLFLPVSLHPRLKPRVGVARNPFPRRLSLPLLSPRSGKVVTTSSGRTLTSLLWIRSLSKWLTRGWREVYRMRMMWKWRRSTKRC